MKPERPKITKADRKRLARLDRQIGNLQFNLKYSVMAFGNQLYHKKWEQQLAALDKQRMLLRNWMKYGGDKP